MEAKSATDILKEAILLERRGKAFYSMTAANTTSEAAKKIFSMMAEEEDSHIKFLSEQFAHYESKGQFKENAIVEQNPDEDIAMKVLSADIVKQVTAASYEAAAISAAIDFETRAVKIYSERAEAATDANEKEMYTMLADWEKTHHFWLHKMNEELKESVWFDNHFWPF
jgi:rubrerythrin